MKRRVDKVLSLNSRNKKEFLKKNDQKTTRRAIKPKPISKPSSLDVENVVRLNSYMQKLGIASRRKADLLILSGKVKVDGKLVKKLGSRVKPDSVISVENQDYGKVLEKKSYIFYKPFRFITSRKDKMNRSIIFDLPALGVLPLTVQSVGRLDYRSEGLLILTNDGDLAYSITHPKFSIEKTYVVLLSTLVKKEEIAQLRKGVELEDGFAKPQSIKLKAKEKLGRSIGQWVEITVTEGRNRLVRRMFELFGYKVVRLIRVRIGDIKLPSRFEPGQIRPVNTSEKDYLQKIKKQTLSMKNSIYEKENLLKKRIKNKISLNDKQYALKEKSKEIKRVKVAKEKKRTKNK